MQLRKAPSNRSSAASASSLLMWSANTSAMNRKYLAAVVSTQVQESSITGGAAESGKVLQTFTAAASCRMPIFKGANMACENSASQKARGKLSPCASSRSRMQLSASSRTSRRFSSPTRRSTPTSTPLHSAQSCEACILEWPQEKSTDTPSPAGRGSTSHALPRSNCFPTESCWSSASSTSSSSSRSAPLSLNSSDSFARLSDARRSAALNALGRSPSARKFDRFRRCPKALLATSF
mmetsp:Transcript_13554/g.50458  ORF Transcript_13554/g.50458 Transcript_13554/m.50458 type:complete len:237 (+) Transcript_13554:1845-2555(+)